MLVDEIEICFIVKEVKIDKALNFNKKILIVTCFYFINKIFALFTFITFLIFLW